VTCELSIGTKIGGRIVHNLLQCKFRIVIYLLGYFSSPQSAFIQEEIEISVEIVSCVE